MDVFKREPMTNAVLINFVKVGDKIEKIVTTECLDKEMLPMLEEEARQQLAAI